MPSSSGAEVHFFGAGDGFPLPKGDDHGTLRDKLDNGDVKQCKNGRAKWKVNVTSESFSKGVMFQLVSITAFLCTQVSET